MDIQFAYPEMTEHLEGLLLEIYLRYLEIDNLSKMRCDYTLLLEEGDHLGEFDEIYEVPHPELFICDLEIKNAISNDLCIGDIKFGRYKDRKIIIEQDACSLLVYWKSC